MQPIDRFCQAIAGHDGAVDGCARMLGLDPSAVDADVIRVRLGRELGQLEEVMAAQAAALIGELLNQAQELEWLDGFADCVKDIERDTPLERVLAISQGIAYGIQTAKV